MLTKNSKFMKLKMKHIIKVYKTIILLLFLIFTGVRGFSQNVQNEQDLNIEKRADGSGKPMNVIFILSDDHRYDFMGFMDNMAPWLETPNLDRLAREGAHVKNAFVTTSLCSPSRASILTGQYSHVHEVVDNFASAPEDLIYFPQYLQKVGYNTGFMGKWHMGSKDDKPRKGFDDWVSFKGQGIYFDPELNVNGKMVEHSDSAYIASVLTDYALDFLKKQKKDKPFFLYLSHKNVHDNFSPIQRDAYKYHGKKIDYPASKAITDSTAPKQPNVNYEKIPNWVKAQRDSWHGVDYAYYKPQYLDTVVWRYAESLYSMDREIGRVLDFVENSDLAENTVIIYMGDNGFSFGEHGLIDKRQMYEESVRVPLLVKGPQITEPSSVIEQMIQNIDIAPTILELAGLETPTQMNGRSFLPLLRGKDIKDWRDRIFYEYYWEYDFPQTPTVHGVRTDKYKYMRFHGIWDTNEFYDLKNDPEEKNNLIADPRYQDQIKDLANELYDWLESTGGMKIPLKRTVKYPMGDHINKNSY